MDRRRTGPGAFSVGGVLLVAVCIAAAAQAGEPGEENGPPKAVLQAKPLPSGVARQQPAEPAATAIMHPGGRFMPATVLGPARGVLPQDVARVEIDIALREPLAFPDAVRRIGILGGFSTRVEERPSRVVDGAVTPPPPPPVMLSHSGPVLELLDLVAARSGYNWDWEAADGNADGTVVFHRYWDREQRGPSAAPTPEQGIWVVDPARHRTVRDVLVDWGRKAGWRVDWRSSRDFTVSAHARFVGGFLRATDQVLSADELRRVLKPRVHHGNRWLVVEDAGI